MVESFRRTADVFLGSEQSDIGDLLPSVFGGRMEYTTKCSSCDLESTRSDNFMELLIPILDCKEYSPARETRHPGQTTQTRNESSDVDVQRCVNSYLQPERLEEDNQYQCPR